MQMTQTTLVHGIYGITMRLENMILVQLKMEERQATCGGLSPGKFLLNEPPCHLSQQSKLKLFSPTNYTPNSAKNTMRWE